MTLSKFIGLSLVLAFVTSPIRATFKEEIDTSGIDFVHFNGMSGQFYFHEMMGGGVALFDYDNDGDLDAYFSQGNMIDNISIDKAIFKPTAKQLLGDRLYRNDSHGKTIKFTDVTQQAKIKAMGYGMGVTTGDIDNDGDVDIYLSNYGNNQLLQNNGDGTFTDITQTSKTNDPNWSVTATFLDYDKDGYLDLYVVNYVDYSTSNPIVCKSYDGAKDYCSPQGFKATNDSLFHNNGDGRFTNITSKSGIIKEREPGLGVVTADFNKDAYVDLYVANDGRPNILWLNNRQGGFINKAMTSGVAVNMSGMPEASMGVDAADFDNDGDVDLFMTHLNRQTNTLYINNGKAWFSDAGIRMGVSSSSFKYTGFGTKWFDFNNDGYLDLFSANGAVIKESKQITSPFPLKQSNQLWKNLGNSKYQEVSSLQDPSFLTPGVSRGAAFGDIDNDGDIDILVGNNAGKPQLLINNNTEQNNWLGLHLVRNDLHREDLGARIETSVDNRKIDRYVKRDGSYASSHDSRVLIGLGKLNDKNKVKIKIFWSDGTSQTLTYVKINTYQTITREDK